jgi:hypothetical protein
MVLNALDRGELFMAEAAGLRGWCTWAQTTYAG